MIEPSCGIQIISSRSIKGAGERVSDTSTRGSTPYKMLHQVLLLLSSLSLALALGYGSGQYHIQQKIDHQPIGQYSIGDDRPSPYSFSYTSLLKEGSTSHRESGDGSGKVSGSYSLSENDGRKRTVDYSADAGGFVASIQTNEFGTKSENPAHVKFLSTAQQGAAQTGLAGATQGAGQFYSSLGQQAQNQATQYTGSAPDGKPFPYSFGYSSQSEDGSSSHSESSDGSGKVTGSYSLSVKDGRRRNVQYSADAGGFKASVDTNEFGTKSDSPADVKFHSSAPDDASFYAPLALSGGPGAAPSAGPAAVPSYSSLSQGSYQPAQYSIGSAPEGKPFPYSFGYSSQAEDGSSSRSESSDGSGKVSGSYSLSVKDGRRRNVQYSADASGFRASVDTNEFGTKSDSPADVKFLSSAPADPSFSSPVGPSAPQPGAPGSYAAQPGAPASYAGQPGAPASYIPGAHQPTQYSFGSAPEGKPFPYSFGYSSQAEDGSSSRSESSDGSGKVSGSYSLSVKDGRRRNVQYSADASGFKASVDTNEFGTKSDNPADVKFHSSAPADASFSAPLGYSAQPGSASGAPSYAALGQGSYQPTQYSIGSAPEGKPFPYSFSYDNKWQDGGNSRKESSDGSGRVSGSYSLFNADGRRRTVDYSADTAGFKASVQTNEFGTKSDSPADVQFYSSAPAAVAPEATGPTAYSSISSGPTPSVSYGPSTQIQQQHQPIQFNIAPAPEGHPSPYSYFYQSQLDDGSSSQKESSDGSGKVTGSYSLTHKDGRRRTVDYSADLGGFKASVQTNELGTKSDNPADVKFLSSAPADFPAAGGATFSGSVYQSSSSSAQLYGSSLGYQPQGPQSPSVGGHPGPYQFGYNADADGGASSRKEAADSSGKVTGTYSVTNQDGSTRLVEYIADNAGFRAKVKTNEPGTKSGSPADVTVDSSAPIAHPEAQAHSSAALFPARTYTPKSSMIGQAKLW